MAEDLTAQVLSALNDADGPLLTAQAFPKSDFNTIKSAVDKLRSREYLEAKQVDRIELVPTAEGATFVQHGSPEARVYNAVKEKGKVSVKELPSLVGDANVARFGQGQAMKMKWITKDGDSFVPLADSIQDMTGSQLKEISKEKTLSDSKAVADLKKRKLITERKVVTFEIRKGPKFALEFVKEQTDLTAEMIADGSWKTVKLKPYNFKAKGAPTPSGALHPLNKVRQEFREIFFEMGFEEMPTNKFVETGFWNFDALFVPQQHPARDQQDTFFISDPPKADPPREDPPTHVMEQLSLSDANGPNASINPQKQSNSTPSVDYKQYWDNVKAVHQEGKYGSTGYRYPWSADESLKLVLRTHTTAISTYMLKKLAENPRPIRYFSIDRVFRNETVDATHLAEFHQVEGVIADWGLTLGGLIGFMEVFFAKMGITDLRFKPAYNPYTEPSMEIFSYHKGLGKWVEIGNSGMFRPEMLEPMGLPKDMRIYGWGLSLERPTMIK